MDRRRTTSFHLHVVSAGNFQRNSSAVSECQEELSNTIILLSTTRRKPTFEPHETLTLQPQYSEGDNAPFHTYAYDRKRTWSLYFLARQQFTVSKIAEYTIERRDRLGRYGQDNNTTTTTNTIKPYLREHDHSLSITHRRVETNL
jgi:hypothetical protein